MGPVPELLDRQSPENVSPKFRHVRPRWKLLEERECTAVIKKMESTVQGTSLKVRQMTVNQIFQTQYYQAWWVGN